MKNKITYLVAGLVGVILISSCKEEFLDRPSLNNPTLDVYYTTPAEVNLATGLLYNQVWYDYIDKAFHCVGEVMSGNMLTSAGDANYGSNTYVYFTIAATDGQLLNTWQANYKVAGNATVIMNTFEQKKAQVSDPAYLDLGIAEARFMRGAAYFNIARVFGDVPIVTDPVALASSGNYNVPRYFQKDVLRFALEDFKAAEAALPDNPYQPGRVTKYSAKGMAAKLYLYRANVHGNPADYDSARMKAAEVISSMKYDLYPNYQNMFTTSSANNNIESLFALQWVSSGGYSYANAVQAYAAPSTLLKPEFNTGYSSVIPSLDLLNSYNPQDRRRQWSVMEHGFSQPAWKNVNFPSGFIYDTTHTGASDDPFKIKTGTRSNSLKYIVGPRSTGEALNTQGGNNMNIYVLRFADVLLIYSEAVLATNAATTDAAALTAFNRVHNRQGNFNNIPVTSLTKDIIMRERRAEFAFEGDYWFDVQRQGFAKAKQILEAQERGTRNGEGTLTHVGITLNSATQLFLPIPQQETVVDPALNQPAVPYY